MPSDETRRILRMFGVAVTAFEDAVEKHASSEELKKTASEVETRLQEVTALVQQLKAKHT